MSNSRYTAPHSAFRGPAIFVFLSQRHRRGWSTRNRYYDSDAGAFSTVSRSQWA